MPRRIPFQLVTAAAAVALIGAIGWGRYAVGGLPAIDAYNVGRYHLALGNGDEALAAFNDAIRMNPQYVQAYIARGKLYAEAGQLDSALADLDFAIQVQPHYSEAFAYRGYVLLKQGIIDRALADFNQALRIDPKYARVYQLRGEAFMAQGNVGDAQANFQAAMRIDPSLRPDRPGADGLPAEQLATSPYHAPAPQAGTWPNQVLPGGSPAADAAATARQPGNESMWADIARRAQTPPAEQLPSASDEPRGIVALPPVDESNSQPAGEPQASPFDRDRLVRIMPLGQPEAAEPSLSDAVESPQVADLPAEPAGDELAAAEEARLKDAFADLRDVDVQAPVRDDAPPAAVTPELETELEAAASPQPRSNPAASRNYLVRGMSFAAQGKLEQAIDDYTTAIRLNPESVEAYSQRAETLAQCGRTSEALADYSLLIDRYPGLAEPYYHRGRLHAQSNNLDDALTDLSAAIRLQSDYALAHYERGRVYTQLGELEAARGDQRRAFELNPALAGTYERYVEEPSEPATLAAPESIAVTRPAGEAATSAPPINDALVVPLPVIALDSAAAQASATREVGLHPSQPADDAAQQADSAPVTLSPELSLAQPQMTEPVQPTDLPVAATAEPVAPSTPLSEVDRLVAEARQRAAAEVAALTAASQYPPDTGSEPSPAGHEATQPQGDPTDAPGYVARAQAYLDQGHFVQAEADYSEALVLDEQSIEALSGRGWLRLLIGRYEEAMADFNQLVAYYPGMAQAYVERGRALAETGRLDEALDDLDVGLRLRPDHADALVTRAGLWMRLQRPEDALVDLSAVINIFPGVADGYANRADALAAVGRVREAIDDYTVALRLEPQRADLYRQRGSLLATAGDFERAMSDFEQAFYYYPDDAATFIARGKAWLAQQAVEQAIADFTRAIELDVGSAEAHYERGRAYAAKGAYQQAVADQKRARELGTTLQ